MPLKLFSLHAGLSQLSLTSLTQRTVWLLRMSHGHLFFFLRNSYFFVIRALKNFLWEGVLYPHHGNLCSYFKRMCLWKKLRFLARICEAILVQCTSFVLPGQVSSKSQAVSMSPGEGASLPLKVTSISNCRERHGKAPSFHITASVCRWAYQWGAQASPVAGASIQANLENPPPL